MNEFLSDKIDSYFEKSQTTVKSEKAATAKQVVDSFGNKIVDSRYSVKRPTAKIIGHVKK
jgi:hypothetical protein